MNPNNLNAIRLIAAFLVLYGHSFVFLGLPHPLFLSWITLGPLGVYVFFTISGYLIAESWDRDPHLGRFFARRALRIFPGLAVCIVLSAFILGPLLTTLPLKDYFDSIHTWNYLHNIALYITYYLPGVFEANRVPNATNGSLWSLPVEFFMYIIVAMIGLVRGNRWVYLGLVVSFALITFFWAQRTEQMLVVYATDVRQVFLCGIYFCVGAVFYKFDIKRYFSLSVVMLAVIALLCLERWIPVLAVAAWILLPVVTLAFGFAYSPLLNRLIRTGDYSYGIYIYAFPIQQTIVYLYPDISLRLYLSVCSVLTLICAILSWHLIEQRALSLKPRRTVVTTQ
ncbi:MAG: acyltransferase [Methylococcales bacterium]|nr:acyltransferase [Methylococcales bacterium]